MTTSSLHIAVIGATGNVGREILSTIAERQLPYSRVSAIASSDSRGKQVSFGLEQELSVYDITQFDFHDVDVALCSAGSEVARFYAPKITAGGAILIDNSSAFRKDPAIPLVVPEVNGRMLNDVASGAIIANPNCVAIPAAMVAQALLATNNDIRHLHISSYQSTSGAGKAAMDELYQHTKQKYLFQESEPQCFPRSIAFNVIPQIGDMQADGYSGEEDKIMHEVQKILDITCTISATAVRVPVFVGHSISMEITFADPITTNQAEAALRNFPGIILYTDDSEFAYATPAEIVGEDAVFVSRVRVVRGDPNKLLLWAVSDNLRKGAALNAVQIAELLLKNGCL